MSNEHSVTYSAIAIPSPFADDASNSFFANTRACLFIDGLYMSSVLT